MTVWPEHARMREPAEAEPVASALEVPFRTEHPPPVELDAAPPSPDAAPALPPPPEPVVLRRGRLYSAGILLALGLSALVHAGVLTFLLDRLTRPGAEASIDAVNVAIILETPEPRARAGTEASMPRAENTPAEERPLAEPAPEQTSTIGSANEISTEATPTPQEQAAAPPTQAPTETAEPLREIAQEQSSRNPAPEEPVREEPEELRDANPATRKPDGATDPQAVETAPEEPPTQPSPEVPEPRTEVMASVLLPTEDIPVPTPRPEPPKATRVKAPEKTAPKQARSPAKADRKHPAEGRARASRPAATAKKPTGKQAKPAQRASAGSAPGRRGGATAGELQAYARRLTSHVQRHQRYPPGVTGISATVRLAIRLGPQGNFVGASLGRSSGHRVFDQEALAAARRAAPYPRPPSGYRGGTVSVNLRFQRR
ncbi:TonB family protein [Chelativorans sp.]|uniref:cell envelope integrity protein TolA n=1 Tax=Chelativorans sp. TaxID=2203393 RepID=UPI00281274F0|nr:TonB family protein [Chelativorans sp.]